MSTVIQDSIADGSLVLWHDYRAGHTLDLSGNGNNGVIAGSHLDRNGIRFGLSTSEVAIADSAELQLTTGAIVVLGEFYERSVSKIVSKRDGGGTNYDFGSYATGISIYDGTSNRTRACDYTASRCIAINLATAGGTCEGFLNGISIGSFSGTTTFTANDAPIIIGNFYTGSNQFANVISSVLIFNDILTTTEMAQVYSELHENGGPSS